MAIKEMLSVKKCAVASAFLSGVMLVIMYAVCWYFPTVRDFLGTFMSIAFAMLLFIGIVIGRKLVDVFVNFEDQNFFHFRLKYYYSAIGCLLVAFVMAGFCTAYAVMAIQMGGFLLVWDLFPWELLAVLVMGFAITFYGIYNCQIIEFFGESISRKFKVYQVDYDPR